MDTRSPCGLSSTTTHGPCHVRRPDVSGLIPVIVLLKCSELTYLSVRLLLLMRKSLRFCRITQLLLNSEIFEMEFIIRIGKFAAPDANVDVLLKPNAFLRSGFPLFTVKAYLANHFVAYPFES